MKSFLLALLCAIPAAHGLRAGVVLTFDQTNPAVGDFVPVNTNYGDRVTALSDAAGSYGSHGSGGFTPNLVVDYSNDHPSTYLSLWTTGFGSLINVLHNDFGHQNGYTVTITADAGYRARLHSFDLAGWLNTDYVIPGFWVSDGTTILYSRTNPLVRGATGAQVTSVVLAAALEARILQIHIDTTGMNGFSDNIGLDNIAISQAEEPVPEPMTGGLTLAALLAMGARVTRAVRAGSPRAPSATRKPDR